MNRPCEPGLRPLLNHYSDASSFSYQELISLSEGRGPVVGFPKLPKPGMLMLDRIVSIDQHGGSYGKGQLDAEFDISPDHWFFRSHFENDPVMPGSLGVDGLCQLVGFYLGWRGYRGKGRALGVGKTRYKSEILPHSDMLEYHVDIKTIRNGDFPFAIAEGVIASGGETVTEVWGIRVGIKPD
ncbi:MAG: bifunctional 3-hydroxydecanoyl-ACP dehydratase/trans-2-decenoyl-ACP isomerase [Acidiferrobacterales bacterium]|nr:bifunctional 3-hydroxydecanoyl-ACP dehydratase/trans-2-decenoyl-ACP isomerase [Acidiferrobacterales bacterium]